MLNYKIAKNIILLILFSTLFSCGDKCINGNDSNIETRELSFKSFNAIETNGSMDVFLTQGDHIKVEAVGNPEVIDNLEQESKIEGNQVTFQTKDLCYLGELDINITLPEFILLKIDGSGHIETVGNFDVINDLDLIINGSGHIDVQNLRQNNAVPNNKTDIVIDGSGDVTLTGSANRTNIEIDGSGNFNGFEYESNAININVSGSGNCNVNAINELEISLNGSGNICYKGNPSLQTDLSGSGNINDCN